MHISVKGRQIDVGDALRAYAQQSLEGLVGKYFDRPIEASVVFSRSGHTFNADISAHPSRGVLVQGSGAANDAYAALDVASERIARQLHRYKQRLGPHKGKVEVDSVQAQQFIIAADEEEVPVAEGQPVIIAEMTADVPICTVSGAVMRLDLADAPAVLFRNSAHGGLNMIYRRPDGNIGWIDPQGIPRRDSA
ncbi:MAG: ribosome-associated translation inhibitor RaiA [Alphaproteobacteria bacterium]|nr:ribosome-associated translation inhibitor RaiA [Alphaproteobacteria bacterium]